MPKITKDMAFEEEIIEKIISKYTSQDTRAGKWHVSDILFPRYAIWNRLTGRKPTREDVGFFMTGEAYHWFIQEILGKEDAEVKGEFEGITATTDFLSGDLLIEIKTSRKWTIPEDPQDHYVDQIRYYCAVFGKPSAKIMVIFPTAGRKWDGTTPSTVEVAVWDVKFSQEELEEAKEDMRQANTLLQAAWEAGKGLSGADGKLDISGFRRSLSNLPPCPAWKYGAVERDTEKKEYFIKVRCPYAESCITDCARELTDECQRKNDNRRIKPGSSNLAKRYDK